MKMKTSIMKTPDKATLPEFDLVFSRDSDSLQVSFPGIRPEPVSYSDDRVEVWVLGNPIIGERIDKQGVIEILRNGWHEDHIRGIDGEFLIFLFDKRNERLWVINDRFVSVQLFYLVDDAGKFHASTSYLHLWQRHNLAEQIDSKSLFEFMWLHRMLGDHTFDKKSTFLSAASILEYDGKTTQVHTYWRPSFRKTNASVWDIAHELARLIRLSLQAKTSDNPRTALFLSGGLDSRSLLAAFEKKPVCFTLAVSLNNEYHVARRLAEIAGAEHVYLKLPEDKYSLICEKAVRLGAGMYVYDHALFLDYGDDVAPRADVAFHGHGFDYMFQGMYVPVRYRRFLGKNTLIPTLAPIDGSAAEFYLHNVPYRLKGVNLLDYVKAGYRDEYYQDLLSSVSGIIEESDVEFNTVYDQYEYLIVNNLSRHYSNTNISSLTQYIEQRTASFQNGIFDLFFKTPIEYRMGGTVARKALYLLDKRLAREKTANMKMRAVSSPYEKTFWQFVSTFLLRSGIIKETLFNPTAEERTWPLRDTAIRQQPFLRKTVLEASGSERLDALGFFDMDRIHTDVSAWLDGRENGGAMMATLINMDQFLKTI